MSAHYVIAQLVQAGMRLEYGERCTELKHYWLLVRTDTSCGLWRVFGLRHPFIACFEASTTLLTGTIDPTR
jgi:hypothetical protein